MLDFVMYNILYFLILFLVVFLVDFYFLSSKKENKKRVDKMTNQAEFIISRYNVDMKKFSLRRLNFHISIMNGFIISFVAVTIPLIKVHVVVQLLIGFVMMFSLIYSIYEIYGRHVKRKYGKN